MWTGRPGSNRVATTERPIRIRIEVDPSDWLVLKLFEAYSVGSIALTKVTRHASVRGLTHPDRADTELNEPALQVVEHTACHCVAGR